MTGQREQKLVLAAVGLAAPERGRVAERRPSTATCAPGGDDRSVTSIGVPRVPAASGGVATRDPLSSSMRCIAEESAHRHDVGPADAAIIGRGAGGRFSTFGGVVVRSSASEREQTNSGVRIRAEL